MDKAARGGGICARACAVLLLVAIAGLLPGAGAAQQVVDFAPFVYDPARPKVLRLAGDIDIRTPVRLGHALNRYPEIDTLELASSGGSAFGALLMTDPIAAAGLKTEIPAGEVCLSACSFLYLAGVERSAAGQLGVHQLSGADLASGQIALNDVLDMFARFDVPDEFRRRMLDTPAEGMYIWSAADLARLGLIGPAPGRAARHAGNTGADTPTGRLSKDDSPEIAALRDDAWDWFTNGMQPVDGIAGHYSGTYVCGEAEGRVTLTLDSRLGSGAFTADMGAAGGTATFTFGDRQVPGSYGSFELVYSVTGRRVTAMPVRWIEDLPGYVMVGFDARLSDDGTRLEGRISHDQCGALSVARAARDAPDVTTATARAAAGTVTLHETYVGFYDCARARTGVTLTTSYTKDGSGTLTFAFGDSTDPAHVGEAVLVFRVEGTRVVTTPFRWLTRPEGYPWVGFDATVSPDGSHIEGRMSDASCGRIVAVGSGTAKPAPVSVQDQALVGTFVGAYVCAQGRTPVTVELKDTIGSGTTKPFLSKPAGSGTFTFGESHLPDQSGAYRLHYTITDDTISARPNQWIRKPDGYEMVGFVAKISPDRNRLEGNVRGTGCGEINLVRVDG